MTAGPDERTLHAVRGGEPETEQEAEDRIRQELHRRVDGTGREPSIPAQPEPADADLETGEQEPEQAAPARALNDRLVEWWRNDKPRDLDDDEQDDVDDEPDSEEKSATHGPRPSRRRVSKGPTKDDDDDEDDDQGDQGDQDDEDDEDDEPDSKAGASRKSTKGKAEDKPRWARPALGRPPGPPPEKHNLFTWYRGMEPHTRWLIYHGTGLGAGLYFGVPAYGYEGHRFIADRPADDLEAVATWGLLGLLLMADYRVRNLFPLLAWAVRALSTSVVVGALWYSAPLTN
ncbi:hypothetical protein ACIP2X_18840 [Streptomyces sp. NPDC089424]|uniref:hypothetical protein n=1 Tax=Streptomyces sp. NPDC089424 TaxID=3365917 RepID=UPI0038244106